MFPVSILSLVKQVIMFAWGNADDKSQMYVAFKLCVFRVYKMHIWNRFYLVFVAGIASRSIGICVLLYRLYAQVNFSTWSKLKKNNAISLYYHPVYNKVGTRL